MPDIKRSESLKSLLQTGEGRRCIRQEKIFQRIVLKFLADYYNTAPAVVPKEDLQKIVG